MLDGFFCIVRVEEVGNGGAFKCCVHRRQKGKPTVQLEWNRSETIALAKSTCTHCRGLGLRQGRKGKKYPCNCVFRAIFRACYTRFRDCVEQERYLSTISLDWCADASGGKRFYGRKL